jgi:thioesterase domain-containing protein
MDRRRAKETGRPPEGRKDRRRDSDRPSVDTPLHLFAVTAPLQEAGEAVRRLVEIRAEGEGIAKMTESEKTERVVMAENDDKSWTARELAASGASLSEIATELARAEAATAEPRTHALPKSSVNKIIWAQAGRVTDPGRYMFKFGWLTVTAEDLAIWKQYPNAAFTLLRTVPAEEAEDEFRLGVFELRENISLSEK